MLLIPSIDLRGGQCVRLLKGDFAAETRYAATPLELLQRYRGFGASWLHIVDLDGARDGTQSNRELICQLAAQRSPQLQVGGGIRGTDTIDALLACGVARVVIGSVAAEQPDAVTGWLERYGAERICLAFDIRHDAQDIPRIRTRGWREATALSLWEVVANYGAALRHVLCTDIERDGALAGPNLALYQQALRRFPHIAWQASGGVSSGADLRALARLGVPAAISGKALLEERIELSELRTFLPNA